MPRKKAKKKASTPRLTELQKYAQRHGMAAAMKRELIGKMDRETLRKKIKDGHAAQRKRKAKTPETGVNSGTLGGARSYRGL